MPTVQFTSNLRRFYPNLKSTHLEAHNVKELIAMLNQKYPGIKKYLLDDQSRLRHHVNIFINDIMIDDRIDLSDSISSHDKIFIMQALSGG